MNPIIAQIRYIIGNADKTHNIINAHNGIDTVIIITPLQI